jgi:hypothetical protein
MRNSENNKNAIRIATATMVVLSVALLLLSFFASINTVLLSVGICGCIAIGLLVYLILRPIEPRIESDTLELLFQLSKDESVEQAQKNISRALRDASKRKDSIFQNLLEERLATIANDVRQLGKGRIEFANTESWRIFYEQLLRSPSTTLYRSVAHVETQHYWQDGAGQKSTALNLDLHDSGKVSIERIVVLADHLWPEGDPFPVKPIHRWIDEQHRHGIWIEVVKESALAKEPELMVDFGIYGFRAVGRQLTDSSGRTTKFTLSFEFDDVKNAENTWERLKVFSVSFAEILDRLNCSAYDQLCTHFRGDFE